MRRLNLIVALSRGLPRSAFKALWNVLPQSITSVYDSRTVIWRVPTNIIGELNTIPREELLNTVVVCNLDPAGPDPWDLKQLGVEGRGFAATLVLAFPEVYFVFLGGPGPIPSDLQETLSVEDKKLIEAQRESINSFHVVEWPQLLRLAELLHRHAAGFRTLFDPSGLRSSLKLLLLDISDGTRRGLMYRTDIAYRLNHRAAVADEESDYTFVHAYAAFKYGYRVSILLSEEEFNRVLKTDKTVPELVISDWDLAYADHEELSQGDSTELLEGVGERLKETSVIVVSAQSTEKLTKFLQANGARERRRLAKPYGGCNWLLKENQQLLFKKEPEADRTAPNPAQSPRTPTGVKNHSLPYARSVITSHLLVRARGIPADTNSPIEDGVLQAVLALEAKELLGELTRTTAYDALRLQIDGEVLAELAWYGVDFKEEAGLRIDSVERDTDKLCKEEKRMGADDTALQSSQYGFLYSLVDHLRRRYSERGQIVAAELCLRKTNEFEALTRPGNWFITRFWIYVQCATDHGTSIGRIALTNAAIVSVAGIFYFALLVCYPLDGLDLLQQFGLAFGHSLLTFVQMQPGVQEFEDAVINRNLGVGVVFSYRTVLFIELAFAYLNLGLLISVLYRKLMRSDA